MKRIAVWTLRVLILIALLSCSIAVHATDGVIEINQTRILSAGGHFPLVISQPGSYRLTSNLDVTVDSTNPSTPQNRSAITVNVNGVSIDLNGFSVVGPTSCSGGPPVTGCAPVGTGNGIFVYGENVSISNGSVGGFGNDGVSGGALTQIARVHVASNGADGILILGGSSVRDCESTGNGARGIYTPTSGNVISGNVVSGNGNTGISAGGNSRVVGNIAASNALDGIGTLSGTGGSVLIGNTVVGNLVGMRMSTGATADGFAQNVMAGNTTNPTIGGVSLGGNLCNGSTTCP